MDFDGDGIIGPEDVAVASFKRWLSDKREISVQLAKDRLAEIMGDSAAELFLLEILSSATCGDRLTRRDISRWLGRRVTIPH